MKRRANDFYATPRPAIDAILRELKPYGASVLEPCMGDGAIVRSLEPYTRNIDWCEIQLGRNFLTYEPNKRYDYVITNPPFSLAQEFIDHSFTMADTVVMLLRLNYLGAKYRREWWKTRQPHAIYVLSDRPKFAVNKDGKIGSDACEYGWYVWKPNEPYTSTQLHWL